MHSKTSEILGHQRDAKRQIALGLWRESFSWERKARKETSPEVADLFRREGEQTLRRATLLYESANREVIPELSDN